MKTEKKNFGSMLFVLCFLAFIFVFAILNIDLTIEPLDNLMQKETGFSGFVEEIQSAHLSDELSRKNSFLNLNGAFARATGRTYYNDRMLLTNGMLSYDYAKYDMTSAAEGLTTFDAYLDEKNIPFLYVQAPCKIDVSNSLLSDYFQSYGNETANELLSLLETSGIDTLDLREWLSSTPEQIERYFFKTDHHWNYTGGFVAFQKIAERMQLMLPEEDVDTSFAQLDLWEEHTLEDWFLGSHGKRVGKYFAGVDDLVYYTPRFETTISTAIPKYRTLTKGDFIEANIRSEYLDEPNYFAENPYCLYIGGDYPLVQHRNADAPNDLKVLMIKDSFMLPVQAYMSTMFTEVDVIDPRHFTESTVAEYIDRSDPDVAIMMMNPSMFGDTSYRDLGTFSDVPGWTEQPVAEKQTVEITASESRYRYCVFAEEELEYGRTYALRFDDVAFEQGNAAGVTVALYNSSTDSILSARAFDVEYYRDNGEFQWVFDMPEKGSDDIQLILYSGIAGQTAGIQAVYKNVSLSVQELAHE